MIPCQAGQVQGQVLIIQPQCMTVYEAVHLHSDQSRCIRTDRDSELK